MAVVTKSGEGRFQDRSGLPPSKTPGPWGSETWRQPYQLLSSRSLSLTVAEGPVGSRAGQSQGICCQATRLLNLEMCVLPSARQSNPQLPAALAWSGGVQVGLYGNSSKKQVLGWASRLGWGEWTARGRPLSRAHPLCPGAGLKL